ncbi:DNA topoisomerase VI subunit B [Candidatus Bathyarchaeota archaeon]|nr:MAG: DNA topoisomerase VI subunit B [Candidatus Bathyarchaeota archaeon]
MSSRIAKEDFYEISPADFFYRNRDIAGFSNPVRAIYSAIREFVENSLDASELHGHLPDIYVRVSIDEESKGSRDANVYVLHVEDNGSGVPPQHVPSAFGQVFYGSKYRLRQSRGTFGLGGTMAILYGQITTNSPVKVISSTGKHSIHEYVLMIDIQRNRPIILKHKTYKNENHWHGTVIEVKIEGDYSRAASKILEYFKQTAIVAPYANITFVDVKGRLYRFERVVSELPKPPMETKPHPYGSDVETIKRMIAATRCRDMLSFMMLHFHRIGKTTAKKFLEFAGIPEKRKPKSLSNDEIVRLVKAMKEFNGFRAPSADCLSPLGENLLRAGIQKELNPEFVSVKQRKPSVYSGYPFIVEVAVAYGGNIPVTGDVILYRFANRIPLLYDEASDVSWKVVHNLINWRHYKIDIQNSPIAVFTHICSTKIPYRSVGKEFIADIPEIEREILGGLREALRDLSAYLTRRRAIEMEKKRFDIFEKYLPKIAKFSAELAGSKNVPDVKPLLKKVVKYGTEKINED